VAQLLVVHADDLRALKDYFLLAKGDFPQFFLEESRPLMRLPPRPATAEEDLRIPWQQVRHSATSLQQQGGSRGSL
jgi:gamma-tubulin complex component 4